MITRHDHRSPRRVWGALLIATSLVASPILALRHQTKVAHRLCAQHGTLERVSRVTTDASVSRPLGNERQQPGFNAGTERDRNHEACHAAQLLRERFAATPGVASLRRAATVSASVARPAIPALGVARYHFAPKHSPPA